MKLVAIPSWVPPENIVAEGFSYAPRMGRNVPMSWVTSTQLVNDCCDYERDADDRPLMSENYMQRAIWCLHLAVLLNRWED